MFMHREVALMIAVYESKIQMRVFLMIAEFEFPFHVVFFLILVAILGELRLFKVYYL